MKNLFFVLVILITMISCKKDVTKPATNLNNTVDTTTQTVTTPLINMLDCSGALINGTLKKGKVVNSVSVKINYTEGNGKAYVAQSISSTSVIGLTAILNAGTLMSGNGSITYEISGTPASAGMASFAINLGGKSCAINLAVEDIAPTSGYGPNITDVDGNTYKTVYIGTQQWMAENLNVSHYNDQNNLTGIPATEILFVTDDNIVWTNLTSGAWTYVNYTVNYNGQESWAPGYGKLYNWYAVSPTMNGNKNICPTGWHVPTDAEWTILTNYLGGESVAGGKMKQALIHTWYLPNSAATNTSLFTALPGGLRDENGSFNGVPYNGNWWSTSEYNQTNTGWSRSLYFNRGSCETGTLDKNYGLSVRCLKD